MAGAQQPRLVGDIGGTHSRLALFDPSRGELRAVRSFTNREHGGLDGILNTWLQDLDGPSPRICCLAVAAPPFTDRVSMLNIDWSFSIQGLADRFGFERVRCINDFEGNAYALPHLGEDDLVLLRRGESSGRKLATVGPGTGLGGATLDYCGDTPVACASEPGHMGIAPANALELELFGVLLARHGQVYAELVLSGPGLQHLYQALAEVRGEAAPPLSPPEISRAALSGESSLCRQTLETFCGLLGSACGDYVLATGSYGGLYLAGGIAPGILPLLRLGAFADRFTAKGNMAQQLGRVPLYAVNSRNMGLIGAAHTLL